MKQLTGPTLSSLTFTCPSTQRLKLQKEQQKKHQSAQNGQNFQLLCVLHLQFNFKNQLSTRQCLRTTSAAYGVLDYK